MASPAEIHWICLETGFTFAKVFYASGRDGLFRRGDVGYGVHGYGACSAAFQVSTSGTWVVGVLLEENFNFC